MSASIDARLELRTTALELSRTERELIAERIAASLDRLGHQVARVQVRISEINRRKGGEDKRVRVRVELARGKIIEVSRAAGTVWEAVSTALSTAQRRCHEHIAQARRPKLRSWAQARVHSLSNTSVFRSPSRS